MKQFKHKKTGKVVRPFTVKGKTYYGFLDPLNPFIADFIPSWVVEGSSEWEELTTTTCPNCRREIAPGRPHVEINSFRDKVNGVIIPRVGPDLFLKKVADQEYKGPLSSFLQGPEDRYEINSVYRRCDRTQFSTGDEVVGQDDFDKIAGFRLENDQLYFVLYSNTAEKTSCLAPEIVKVHKLQMGDSRGFASILAEILLGGRAF